MMELVIGSEKAGVSQMAVQRLRRTWERKRKA